MESKLMVEHFVIDEYGEKYDIDLLTDGKEEVDSWLYATEAMLNGELLTMDYITNNYISFGTHYEVM